MPIVLRWIVGLAVLNPIAVRLVQNGSRRNRHMYIRAAYLAVLIVVLLWLLLIGTQGGNLSYQQLAAAGARSFVYISYLQITLICVLAPVFMGGAISQEAGPHTWDVLLTTPLSPGQIVLGNLFGRLFFVLGLLFCSLPLFALTQYFGGVPGNAIFASYLVAAGAALLVGAIAIGLAVSRLAGKRAFFVFYVCVVSYLGVTIAIDTYLRSSGRGAGPGGDGVTVMTSLNPFLALGALLNPTTYPRATPGTYEGLTRWTLEKPVTTWVVGSSLVSIIFMIGSAITVRRGGLQTLGQGDDGVPLMRRIFGGKAGAAGEHRAPRTVWTNPIAWREAASRNSTPLKIAMRSGFLILGLLFGAGIVALYHFQQMNSGEFQFALAATLAVELMVIALVAINTSATAISKEREDGQLDLLLTTPITASAYLWGKLRGLVTYLIPLLAVPLGTLAIAGIYVAFGGLSRAGGVDVIVGGVTMPVILPESAVFAPIVVVPFMAFCVMVGLHWSLKSKGTLSSTVATVGIVGVVAGIVGLCGWSSMSNITDFGGVLGGLSPASFLLGAVTPDDSSMSNPSTNVVTARVSLAIGALISAGIHAAICYGIHSNMVRSFDMTVRRLAGQG
jgi:ABC-type transport system involved in multi-copper enzyme maturation permease subunit